MRPAAVVCRFVAPPRPTTGGDPGRALQAYIAGQEMITKRLTPDAQARLERTVTVVMQITGAEFPSVTRTSTVWVPGR